MGFSFQTSGVLGSGFPVSLFRGETLGCLSSLGK
jgi:hypothetical protein